MARSGSKIIASHFCAAQADLFLHAKGETQLDILWRVLEQFDQNSHADAVINGLGHDGRPDTFELCGKGGAVSDLCFAFGTEIDAQGIDIDGVTAFLRIVVK